MSFRRARPKVQKLEFFGSTESLSALTESININSDSNEFLAGKPEPNKANGSHRNLSEMAIKRDESKGRINDDVVTHKSKIKFNNADIVDLGILGSGSGGTVTKVMYKPTQMIMARKVSVFVYRVENLQNYLSSIEYFYALLYLYPSV